MRSWDIGSASQLEHARHYTAHHASDSTGWIALADAMWSLSRYKEAKAALRNAERLASPHSRHRVWEQWGHLYREMHDLQSAETWFRKAVREHPSTRGHIFLGATLALLGRRREAEREHRAAIAEATPGHAVDEAHFNLALILRSFERYDEALKHLDQALKIDPSYSKAQEVVRDIRRAKWLANQRRPPTRLGTVDVKRRVPVRGRASGR